MRIIEGAAHFDANVRSFLGQEALGGRRTQKLRDAHALDELHREEVGSAFDAEFVHGNDIGMREGDRGFGFFDESANELVVARELVAYLLDDEFLLEPARASQRREHDASHAPAGQLAFKDVFAEDLGVHSVEVGSRYRSKCAVRLALALTAASACHSDPPLMIRIVTMHAPPSCGPGGPALHRGASSTSFPLSRSH